VLVRRLFPAKQHELEVGHQPTGPAPKVDGGAH
jgi:hypothetical protein